MESPSHPKLKPQLELQITEDLSKIETEGSTLAKKVTLNNSLKPAEARDDKSRGSTPDKEEIKEITD